MGEFATFAGKRVKIGTCEDMYYLRADQVGKVQRVQGSLDPGDGEVQAEIRFRFPWPDEDNVAPGEFEPYERAVGLYGVQPPEGVCLPCPESTGATHGLTVHRNGFAGPVKIVQQAYRGGNLALICQCGGCGARYNLPTLADAEPVIAACRVQADNAKEGPGGWWHKVADRIAAGYAGGGQ